MEKKTTRLLYALLHGFIGFVIGGLIGFFLGGLPYKGGPGLEDIIAHPFSKAGTTVWFFTLIVGTAGFAFEFYRAWRGQ